MLSDQTVLDISSEDPYRTNLFDFLGLPSRVILVNLRSQNCVTFYFNLCVP